MSPSEMTNQVTRDEWRELGFFYDKDDAKNHWLLVGSKQGLGAFPTLIRAYCEDPRNTELGEHEHYGPYMYLKIVTAPQAQIDDDSISGSLHDLARLADLMETELKGASPGDVIEIGNKYISNPEYGLWLEVTADSLDPASADRCLAWDRV